jgi:methionyl-tRNA formyltransferase
MRIVFAGTPRFAARALEAILDAGHTVALVLTQPDRPAGRGLELQPSPVKRVALDRGLALQQPVTLKHNDALAPILEAAPDVMVVAAYGLILPQAVLDIPRLGGINIHASLLPRWRGAAPIQRAVLAGDAETGITIMQMDVGLDTGPMLLARALPIGDEETAGDLHERLATLGTELIVEALRRLEAGDLNVSPQPAVGATYAPKIDKAEARIDWNAGAAELARKVRAFNPVPGAFAHYAGTPAKMWRASAQEGTVAAPGTVIRAGADGIVIACGTGALCVTELQKAGGRRLTAAEFLRGTPLPPGARFE